MMIDMRDLLDVPFGTRFVGYYGKGYGNQIPVSNGKQIREIVEEHLGLDNIAISISTYKNRRPHLLFLPFDFDSDNLKDAWKDAVKLYKHVIKSGYGAYLVFSGRKGFHVLITTKPNVYTKRQVRSAQKMFKGMMNLKTLDEQIFGDVRRLMRIPWTYNIYGGLCKVIASNEGIELDLDEIYIDNITDKDIEFDFKPDRTYHDYPCIESLVRSDPEPRHLIRFTFVVLRLSEGYDIEDILDEIESFDWVDFDEDYTRKQIEHIIGRGYVPPSCNTLRDLGYCNVEDCPYTNDMKTNLEELGIK